MSRRSGHTTRLINEAVESLFENGGIVVPHKDITDDKFKYIVMHYGDYKYFCDADWLKGVAQLDFLNRVIRRMNNEHPDDELTIETTYGYTVIELVNFKKIKL